MPENAPEGKLAPVCTAISLLLTAFVWVVLLMIGSQRDETWGAALAGPETTLVLVAGTLLQGVLGIGASVRREFRGGKIAAYGVGAWLATAAVFALFGRYS